MTYSEIKTAIEKLGETTIYGINLIEIDATQKIYDKYELPALFIEGQGEFHQGDATDEEIQETINRINEMYPEMTDLEESEDLFKFLQEVFQEAYAEETLRVIKANWIEYYRDNIEKFLEKEFFQTGEQIEVDWSVWIDVQTGAIWDATFPSSNWSYPDHNPNRKLIVHLNNYDKSFSDHTDLIATETEEVISDNFWTTLPDNWKEMDISEQISWIEKNCKEAVEEYNETSRSEAIENILDNIRED